MEHELRNTIRAALRKLKKTQKKFADEADLSATYLSNVLTGIRIWPNPEASELYTKLAIYLDLNEAYLRSLAHAEIANRLKQQAERHLALSNAE